MDDRLPFFDDVALSVSLYDVALSVSLHDVVILLFGTVYPISEIS